MPWSKAEEAETSRQASSVYDVIKTSFQPRKSKVSSTRAPQPLHYKLSDCTTLPHLTNTFIRYHQR